MNFFCTPALDVFGCACISFTKGLFPAQVVERDKTELTLFISHWWLGAEVKPNVHLEFLCFSLSETYLSKCRGNRRQVFATVMKPLASLSRVMLCGVPECGVPEGHFSIFALEIWQYLHQSIPPKSPCFTANGNTPH